jgi:hypothetical protein
MYSGIFYLNQQSSSSSSSGSGGCDGGEGSGIHRTSSHSKVNVSSVGSCCSNC